MGGMMPSGGSRGAGASPHLRQVPLLAGRHPPGLPPELAVAQLGRAGARPQAQLLADVVPQLPLARVLKVLGGQSREGPSGCCAPRKGDAGQAEGGAGGGSPWQGRGPTWLPPIPWQGYMMSGFPPWLFSPTSRQLLVPLFLIWGGGERRGSG